MLYVSTRNTTDSYTAHRTLQEDCAPDGGKFVPFHLPQLTPEELDGLKEKTFSQAIAQILNLFFSKHLNSWDVEFCIGRYPFKLEVLGQRIAVAQLWHNPEARFSYATQGLYQKLCEKKGVTNLPSPWVRIAVEIAVLFGLFGELFRQGIESADIAVPTDDFLCPIAVWYARRMGLPIHCIICGCNENSGIWDFIHRGELATGISRYRAHCLESDISQSDGLEYLIHGALGTTEVTRYLDVCADCGSYILTEEALNILNQGLFATVIGTDRIDAVISSVYRTNGFVLDPHTAASYGALQDYRARTGENRYTLLLAQCSPLFASEKIASAIGCSQDKLRAMIHLSKE